MIEKTPVVISNLQVNREEGEELYEVWLLVGWWLFCALVEVSKLFEELLIKHPNYVATYYHAAALFADLEEKEKAENTYKKGIELAFAQQKTRAYDELKRAYQAFLESGD